MSGERTGDSTPNQHLSFAQNSIMAAWVALVEMLQDTNNSLDFMSVLSEGGNRKESATRALLLGAFNICNCRLADVYLAAYSGDSKFLWVSIMSSVVTVCC